MMAVKLDNEPHRIIEGEDIAAFLSTLDPKTTTTVAFNALFDNSILSWRYGFVPNLMLDAMGMARALLGHELQRFSLASVAEHMGLGAKGTALMNMMGKRTAEIKAEGLWPEFCAYALQDNVLCEGIFNRLLPLFPKSEWRVMDLVLRCTVDPSFVCDTDMLRDHLNQVKWDKAQLLNNCSIDQIKLMSSAKFKAALEERGVKVQMKMSKTTGKETPAFAKTDDFMAELADHHDPEVQALAAARLGLRSTIEETRTEKLLAVADAFNYVGISPNMPVPLRYGGAHTHRLSGDWGMNMQNLPADRKKDGKSKLRAALKAPQGHKVIVADLGQIECRISAWLAGATTLSNQFANHLDPYAELASKIFERPIDRKVDTIEGFIGKTGVLGLGYGCGKDRFNTMCLQSARMMGLDFDKITRELTDRAVDTYRDVHWELPVLWRKLDRMLETGLFGIDSHKLGPITIRRGVVELPNQLELRYLIQPRNSDGDLMFKYGRETHKIYGAKLLENITQALSRVVIMDTARRLFVQNLRFVLQAHDELVFIVPAADSAAAMRTIHDEMVRAPSWAPTLPLTAAVNAGSSYGEAK